MFQAPNQIIQENSAVFQQIHVGPETVLIVFVDHVIVQHVELDEEPLICDVGLLFEQQLKIVRDGKLLIDFCLASIALDKNALLELQDRVHFGRVW